MAGAESAAIVIASNGLCVGISTALLHSLLSQSSVSSAIVGTHAAQLDPVVLLAAVATFFAAVMLLYIHLRNRNGGVGGVGEQRILEVMFPLLCASATLLDLFLFMQPGPIEDEVLLAVAALQQLPPAAAATFLLAIMLIYVHAGTAGGGGGAANEQVSAMELLNVMTLAATLITGVLSLIAVVLVFNSK